MVSYCALDASVWRDMALPCLDNERGKKRWGMMFEDIDPTEKMLLASPLVLSEVDLRVVALRKMPDIVEETDRLDETEGGREIGIWADTRHGAHCLFRIRLSERELPHTFLVGMRRNMRARDGNDGGF